jgi:hypothetical protein
VDGQPCHAAVCFDGHALMAVEAVLEEDGELGLILASTDGERGRVRLAGITPGTQAERCPGLASIMEAGDDSLHAARGMLLATLRVGASPPLDVRAVGYTECVELIQTHIRPLTFVWTPMVEPTLAPPPIVDESSDLEPHAASSSRSGGGGDDDDDDGGAAESGMATLRRRVSQALSRSSIDDEVQDGGSTPTGPVDSEDSSGLSWTSSNPESLGQLPRVQLSCGVDEQAPSLDGPAATTTPRSVGEAGLETQWKDRERAAHREGYLSQREDGFLSRWQRRWVVVDYGVLNVYKDYEVFCKEKKQAGQDATRPPSVRRRSSSSRQIVVDREDVVDDHADPDASPDTSGQEEFDFVIRLPMDRTLTLRASNQVCGLLRPDYRDDSPRFDSNDGLTVHVLNNVAGRQEGVDACHTVWQTDQNGKR